jgi:hypothetical protein
MAFCSGGSPVAHFDDGEQDFAPHFNAGKKQTDDTGNRQRNEGTDNIRNQDQLCRSH